jgi:hypothetical protein
MTVPMVVRPWKWKGMLEMRRDRPRDANGARNHDLVYS